MWYIHVFLPACCFFLSLKPLANINGDGQRVGGLKGFRSVNICERAGREDVLCFLTKGQERCVYLEILWLWGKKLRNSRNFLHRLCSTYPYRLCLAFSNGCEHNDLLQGSRDQHHRREQRESLACRKHFSGVLFLGRLPLG